MEEATVYNTIHQPEKKFLLICEDKYGNQYVSWYDTEEDLILWVKQNKEATPTEALEIYSYREIDLT